MSESPWWVPIVIALITGGIARDLVTWVRGLRKGKVPRRSELEQAWASADEQSRRRRIAEEHASHLRRRLIEAPCVDTTTIPVFPPYKEKQ